MQAAGKYKPPQGPREEGNKAHQNEIKKFVAGIMETPKLCLFTYNNLLKLIVLSGLVMEPVPFVIVL